MAEEIIDLFRDAKRLWVPGLDPMRINGRSYRPIHIIQDMLELPNLELEHACDRNFFWSIVAGDLQRLDAIYSKAKVTRSTIYHRYLKKLEQFDSERFHRLLTLYPYAVNHIDDESYQWTRVVR